jgi:hypothetical protein
MALPCVLSGFRREVAQNFVLMSYYAGSSGDFLPKFRRNPPVTSLGSGKRTLKTGPISIPETSLRNYHYLLRNNPEEGNARGLTISPYIQHNVLNLLLQLPSLLQLVFISITLTMPCRISPNFQPPCCLITLET